MSAKKQLAEAVQELPDSVTVEEAFERLYRLFKLRHQATLEKTRPTTRPEGADIEERLRRRFPNGEVPGALDRFWQELRAERTF